MSEKGPPAIRPYRSALRQQQAAATRRRVVEAALELFSHQGFHATTLAEIAERAGVAVQTVRKQGPKSALLRAAGELSAFGAEGETDVFDTDVGRALLAVDDPDAMAAAVGDAILAINAPSAAMWIAFAGAAHGDAELAAHHRRFLREIRGQVVRFLRYVDQRGWLRSDLPFEDLVEAFVVITSSDGYVRYVVVDGRPPEEYRDFVTRTVRATVLAP